MDGERNVALIVMAHPDDAEFGCGGTVAVWVREGWDVHYVICTDASAGGPGDATQPTAAAKAQVSATRKAEQRAAADVLGVRDLVFLDYPDGLLQPTIELRRQLVRLMRTYRPKRLVCQSPERSWKGNYAIGRYHPDHLAVAEATIAAMYPASQNPWDFPELLTEEGLAPHKVGELWVMGTPEPNHAVDISSTFETKLQALQAHASQVSARWDAIAERMRTFATDTGALYDLPMAEVFHRTENP